MKRLPKEPFSRTAIKGESSKKGIFCGQADRKRFPSVLYKYLFKILASINSRNFTIDRKTYDSSSSILILQFYSQCQQLLGKDRRKVAAEQGEGLLRHLLCHNQIWFWQCYPACALRALSLTDRWYPHSALCVYPHWKAALRNFG